MNYYYLGERDQARTSWVLFELTKPAPKHIKRAELPPVIYAFLGARSEGEMRIKPEYARLCCGVCGRYDDDSVFDVGFRDPVTIRVKGDFSHTQDRVFIITDRFLNVLQQQNVQGYETKAVGNTGWHALRATKRVDFDEGVMKLVEPLCRECKRAKTTTGMFEEVSQLCVPPEPNTIFTTRRGWPTMFWDRWIFLTEDVAKALKAGGIKGGYCNRFWTDEEVRNARQKAQQGIRWKPRHSTVFL